MKKRVQTRSPSVNPDNIQIMHRLQHQGQATMPATVPHPNCLGRTKKNLKTITSATIMGLILVLARSTDAVTTASPTLPPIPFPDVIPCGDRDDEGEAALCKQIFAFGLCCHFPLDKCPEACCGVKCFSESPTTSTPTDSPTETPTTQPTAAPTASRECTYCLYYSL